MKTNLHENGPWYVDNGLFVNTYSNACTNDPAVYIDTEAGTLLKTGDANMVKMYAATHIDRLTKAGFTDMTKELIVIEFNRYPDAKLDADEICTIMNYLNNCLNPEQVYEILHMNEPQLKEKIAALQKIGF